MSTTLISHNAAEPDTAGMRADSDSGFATHCGSSSGSGSGSSSSVGPHSVPGTTTAPGSTVPTVGSGEYLSIAPVIVQQVSVGMQQLSDALSAAISVAEMGTQGLDILTQLSLATPELYPVCRSFYAAVDQTVQHARSTNDLIADTAHATTLLTTVVTKTDQAIAEALRA